MATDVPDRKPRPAGAAARRRAAEEAAANPVDWMAPFRPVRSTRPGTMPAGTVLFVLVAGLIVALFLTAPAIARKADGRRNNAEWRRTTAHAFASVSEGLRLDRPANAVDEVAAPWLGHDRRSGAEGKSTSELLAEQRAGEGEQTAGADGGSAGTAPAAADQIPKLRTPTVDNPLKVWAGGDSTIYEMSVALENIAIESKIMRVTTDSRPSTGLVRSDYFNWPAHLVRDVLRIVDPDVLVIQFGANDAQNMVSPQQTLWEIGSPEWLTEYRKRVGDTMDLLKGTKAKPRLVLWVGEPPMGPASGVKKIPEMNYIFATEAAKRPWVQYVDAWNHFTDGSGAYAKSMAMADGQVKVLRAGDNIHMSAAGGTRLAWLVWDRLAKLVDLSGAQVQPKPEQMAPPDVVERAEVPPGEGQP